MAIDEHSIARSERRWALAMVGVTSVLLVAILFASIHLHLEPPSNVETIEPSTLHLSEFAEDNLGTSVDNLGGITVRVVTAQFAFQPQCVVVPKGVPVTFRLASPDVIHGISIVGTNVNTMVVPGYVSRVRTTFKESGELLMPCHEFCGMGHSQMLARVRVVPAQDFKPDANGRASCAQR